MSLVVVFICVEDIEIRSDTSLAEAVETLSKLKVLSAPVVDVDAPEDASWIDRYIGIVQFPGIVVWLLHQVTFFLPTFSFELPSESTNVHVFA